MLAVIFFLDGCVLYGLAYFAPSIVQSLGFSPTRAQLMSVPPFAAAFALSMVGAWVSDKFHCRGYICMFSSLMCVVGFGMFLGSTKHHVQYGSLFLSIPGTYVLAPTLCTWSANNAAPHTRRATAIAIGFIMTNSGGILATWLLGSLSPAPRYTKATITLLVFSAIMVVVSGMNTWYLWDQNRRKREVRSRIARHEEERGLGDKSAWFEYNL
jgi:MFS family permease